MRNITGTVPARPREGRRRLYSPRMGFNPFRPQRKDVVDIVMVVGTILVAVALVLWAALA